MLRRRGRGNMSQSNGYSSQIIDQLWSIFFALWLTMINYDQLWSIIINYDQLWSLAHRYAPRLFWSPWPISPHRFPRSGVLFTIQSRRQGERQGLPWPMATCGGLTAMAPIAPSIVIGGISVNENSIPSRTGAVQSFKLQKQRAPGQPRAPETTMGFRATPPSTKKYWPRTHQRLLMVDSWPLHLSIISCHHSARSGCIHGGHYQSQVAGGDRLSPGEAAPAPLRPSAWCRARTCPSLRTSRACAMAWRCSLLSETVDPDCDILWQWFSLVVVDVPTNSPTILVVVQQWAILPIGSSNQYTPGGILSQILHVWHICQYVYADKMSTT